MILDCILCKFMSENKRTVEEYPILSCKTSFKPISCSTPFKNNSTRSINISSDNSFTSFTSVDSEADTILVTETNKKTYISSESTSINLESNMSLEAVTELLAQLRADVTELKKHDTSRVVPPAVPLSKDQPEVDFAATKDAWHHFPPKFENGSKQSATNHISLFENWCLAANMRTDQQKVQWFSFSILGEVYQWYQHTDFFSYQDLKSKFERNYAKYQTREDARIAFQLISLEANERASDYFRRLNHMAQLANMTGDDIKDQFFRGLTPKYQSVKRFRHMFSLDDCVRFLQSSIDCNLDDKTVSFQDEHVNTSNQHSRRSRSSKRSSSRQGKGNHSKPRSDSRKSHRSSSRHRSTSDSRSRSNSRGRRSNTPHSQNCYNCGGSGHYANVCPSNSKRSNSKSRDNHRDSRKDNHRSSRSSSRRDSSRSRSSPANTYYSIQPSDPNIALKQPSVPTPSLNQTVRKVLDIYGNPVFIPTESNVDLN